MFDTLLALLKETFALRQIKINKMKINESLVSGYPTDPNILGPTQTSLQPFRILKSFLDFLKHFSLFPCILF